MDSSGPKKESSDDEEVQKTPAQDFIDSDEVGKKAKLDSIRYVTDIKGILPEDISTLDKDTTVMVLEKALSLCAIPTTSNDVRTDEQTQMEMETLQRQINRLKEMKERNAALLEEHREAKERWNEEVAANNDRKQFYEEQQQEANILREQIGGEHPRVLAWQAMIDEAFRTIQEEQDELDNRKFPLKD